MTDIYKAKSRVNPVSVLTKKSYPTTVLLIDDQAFIAEAIKKMLQDQKDIIFHYCQDPSKAITMAMSINPTVILQDLLMPEIDGLVLLKYFRANNATKDIPMIVLSSKEEPFIKAEAFALGANDYLVKLPDKVELIARIRYHSAAYIRLLERNEAFEKLEESQKILKDDLEEAAAYAKSLLPPPLVGEIETFWRFIPSTQLGGDAFGYHWVDNDHFAVYLLDVCGHGVGAALLSITVMNVLRSETLPSTNFLDPANVLNALNETFPMEKHNNMFFTIWYGVFCKSNRTLVYSSGGHPPAILLTGLSPTQFTMEHLKTPGLVIGGMSGEKFQNKTIKVDRYNRLFVFSDGVYEISRDNGEVLQLYDFLDILRSSEMSDGDVLDNIIKKVSKIANNRPFEDDFSIVKVIFNH